MLSSQYLLLLAIDAIELRRELDGLGAGVSLDLDRWVVFASVLLDLVPALGNGDRLAIVDFHHFALGL